MYDVLIKNVKIVDGTGAAAYPGSVAVADGKIAAVGNVEGEAKTVIDGAGRYLTPGFIDSHGHNDLSIIFNPTNHLKLEQGVTTEISGCCGESLFPVSATKYDEFNTPLTTVDFEGADPNFNSRAYTSGKKWFEYVDSLKLGTNMLMLVGHGAIRATVMGFEDRPATREELDQMKALLREAMEAGAAGMSTGIAYAPGVFTPEEEIAELCSVVAEFGGYYSTHMRNQGVDLLKSVEETLRVTRKTGVKTVISHLKSIGRPNWGLVKGVRKLVDDARAEGLPVTWDSYPYVAGSTTLKITLPPSILACSDAELAQRMTEPKWQNYVRDQIKNPTEKWENAIGSNGFGDIMLLSVPKTPEAEGKTIQEYADSLGKDPYEVYFKLFADNIATDDIKTINFVMCEEDLEEALSCPYSLVGSDGLVTNDHEQVHPRGFGTFPRYLGRYLRDKKMLTLEEGIRKLTGLAAEFYDLDTKGLVKEGYDADLVLLDYDHVIDHAKFGDCFQPNEGIDMVMLAGHVVVENGKHNGQCYGGRLLLKSIANK